MMTNKEIIYLGGGCFWCIESIFNQIKGVEVVISGYMGGTKNTANYHDVCTGKTRHAEVVKVVFDNNIISFSKILEIFFYVHDPTTLNRQGNDVGKHYRSIILFEDLEEKEIIENFTKKMNEEIFDNKIVTEIKKFTTFYKAEEYHQDYFKNNQYQPYCKFVISPKLSKARKELSKYY